MSSLVGGAGRAPADTVAFTNGTRVFTAHADGSGIELRASPPRSVADVAFDRAGELYTSEFGPRAGCDLYRAGAAEPTLRFRDVRARVRGEVGLCDVTLDPRGGMLFDVTSSAFPSDRIWHVDPRTRRIKQIAFGYHPTIAPNGRRMVVVAPRAHYPTLLLGRPNQQPSSFKPIVPTPRSNGTVGYALPAFSPDGTQIAAIRTSARRQKPAIDDLIVGRPGSRLSSIFRVADGRRLGQVSWLSDGRTVLVNVFDRRRASIGDVYRVPLRGGKPRRILQDVTAFAVR